MQRLTAEAFGDRAERLANYLGETAVAANHQKITELIERKARKGDFEEFRAAVERAAFGVVFTAHPTFSIALELAQSLVEMATGQTVAGEALDAGGTRGADGGGAARGTSSARGTDARSGARVGNGGARSRA